MFLTASEVAKMLRLCQSSVYSMIRRNELPHIRFGSAFRMPKAAVEKWIDENLKGVKE